MKQQQAALSLWNKQHLAMLSPHKQPFFVLLFFHCSQMKPNTLILFIWFNCVAHQQNSVHYNVKKSKPSINDMGVVNDTVWMQKQIELQKCERELHYCPCFSEQKDLRGGI